MPDVPPGSSSSDATEPAPTPASGGPGPKARVNANRAAGPKRPPRPAAKASSGGNGPVKGRSGTRRPTAPVAKTDSMSGGRPGPAATAVAERPTTALGAPAVPLDDTGTLPGPPTAAPVPKARAPRPAGVRRGRRVKRVVRRIDLWSVLKLSLVVYSCLYLAVMATLAALWSLLHSTNTIDKFTDFLADVGMENFHFYGDQMFRACAAIGAIGVIAGTVVTVLATALVNIISEMTGGIRLVVIEEDPAN